MWYSGVITEESFMRKANQQLRDFNDLFTLNDRQETSLKDPKARITMSMSYLETLGHALLKAFQQPLLVKDPERGKQQRLRNSVSMQLSRACLNKLWEENFVSNAIQNKLALKTEQLQVADEKSTIQSNLVAVTKRKQNIAEKEVASLKERNHFLA